MHIEAYHIKASTISLAMNLSLRPTDTGIAVWGLSWPSCQNAGKYWSSWGRFCASCFQGWIDEVTTVCEFNPGCLFDIVLKLVSFLCVFVADLLSPKMSIGSGLLIWYPTRRTWACLSNRNLPIDEPRNLSVFSGPRMQHGWAVCTGGKTKRNLYIKRYQAI